MREEWVLSQRLPSILGKNIGWAGDRTSDLLFSSPVRYLLSHAARLVRTKLPPFEVLVWRISINNSGWKREIAFVCQTQKSHRVFILAFITVMIPWKEVENKSTFKTNRWFFQKRNTRTFGWVFFKASTLKSWVFTALGKKGFANIVRIGENADNQHFLSAPPSLMSFWRSMLLINLHSICSLQITPIWTGLNNKFAE